MERLYVRLAREYIQRHIETLPPAQRREAEEIERLMDLAIEEARTDPLTGLCNRELFTETFEPVLKNSTLPFSLAMGDVDHFKRVNDGIEGYTAKDYMRYTGHDAGDHLLTDISDIIQRELREGDVPGRWGAGRWGGEEIVCAFPFTFVEGAEAAANRLRVAIQSETKHTLSFGVSSSNLQNPFSISELVTQADRALYRAKKSGRNNVKVYDPAIDGSTDYSNLK